MARFADAGRMSVYPGDPQRLGVGEGRVGGDFRTRLLADRSVLAAAKAICLIWHDDDLATANEAWFAEHAPYERAALRVLTAVYG